MRVTMLCIKFPELIHLTLKVGTLWLTSSHFPDPPAPSKHHFTLFLSSQESLWHKTLFSGSCSLLQLHGLLDPILVLTSQGNTPSSPTDIPINVNWWILLDVFQSSRNPESKCICQLPNYDFVSVYYNWFIGGWVICKNGDIIFRKGLTLSEFRQVSLLCSKGFYIFVFILFYLEGDFKHHLAIWIVRNTLISAIIWE